MLTKQHRYVERLEAEREVLSLGLREACRRLIVAGCWPTESLPSDGRPHDIHEMLVTLGLIPHSKEKESAGEYLERGDSAQMRRESSPATQHLSVDRTLERSSDWKPYIGRFMEHDVPREAWPRPRNAHINVASAQPIAATPASKSNSVDASSSKKSSNIASRAIDLRPDAAPMAAQDLQTVLSHSHGQIWRHTTDAYQEVSGPSDVRKRSFQVMSTAQDSHHDGITSQHGSDHSYRTYEAVSSGRDETSPESDGDRSDHIKIAF